MILVYTLYSEKDRRLYAAAEALKSGCGGMSYISRVLGCDRKTILRGMADIQKLADEIGVEIRIAHYPSYASKMKKAFLIFY